MEIIKHERQLSRYKILAYFTGAFVIALIILHDFLYFHGTSRSILTILFNPSDRSFLKGYFCSISQTLSEPLSESLYCWMLSPFLVMYIVICLTIIWGDITKKILFAKTCGFSLVYLIWLSFSLYGFVIHPFVGAPIGLPFIILGMLLAMPVIYWIGYGICTLYLSRDENVPESKNGTIQ